MVSQRGSAREAASLGLSVSAVARRLGVAPATLRTWDRRYGVGPTSHEAGAHRRYSAEDLARLEHMRRLVVMGVPLADAAQAALAHEDMRDPSSGDADAVELARGDDDISAPSPRTTRAAKSLAAPESHSARGRSGGGQVIAIPGGDPGARGLARAARALDTRACADIVAESVERRGVIWTWDNLLIPVLTAVGQQWQETGRGIDVEHALSESIQTAFTKVAADIVAPVNDRAVIVASAPEDQHSIPLHAVAAALAERSIVSRVLGSKLPTAALQQAVGRIGPAAVFLWAQIPGTADAMEATRIPVMRPGAAIILGGSGWFGQMPPGAVHVHSLSDATAHIARAVGE